MCREDAAGNRNDDYASQPVRLRHDPEAPALTFEGAPADDPTRVSVAVTEKISGIAGGQIELSRAGLEQLARRCPPSSRAAGWSRASTTPRCRRGLTCCARRPPTSPETSASPRPRSR